MAAWLTCDVPRAAAGMADMRWSALCASNRGRSICVLLMFGCRIPPDMQPGVFNSSPLEGDCRPSRADMTEPDPQGSGFYFCRSDER